MKGNEVVDHVIRNAIATKMIPMDRMDRLKSVAEELEKEEEMARVDNIQVRRAGW